jgi:hypothetical protein
MTKRAAHGSLKPMESALAREAGRENLQVQEFIHIYLIRGKSPKDRNSTHNPVSLEEAPRMLEAILHTNNIDASEPEIGLFGLLDPRGVARQPARSQIPNWERDL